ncbi:hypothetical protein NQ156_05975 [Microbacterium sp. zg.Y625]|uniref:hypothetical protein n=2 Tax=Microbacterium jiangjiandongii TaxID=3049071 RepID=UPI00214AC68C|nr:MULTISPECIES: hypothetical protein [unclassified Microbacterium]MCR2792611.1 hypothetical protein [Microbacterium sp. zg.Y625]WIM26596.1 hypothetical protein QNO14_06000 [Microbacterium sp. zg-Y625]
MDDDVTGLAREGSPSAAREFVPRSHRELPMLRLFLPFTDLHRPQGDDAVRWSRFAELGDHSASLSWFELADRIAAEHPAVRDLIPCRGELDEETAAALRGVIGDMRLRCLRWTGYGEAARTSTSRRVFGGEYFEDDLRASDVVAGRRVPEFAWDAAGRLAWGTRLFPDSLIVAAEPALFRQLHNDPRLDVVSVRVERDVLPPSAGD